MVSFSSKLQWIDRIDTNDYCYLALFQQYVDKVEIWKILTLELRFIEYISNTGTRCFCRFFLMEKYWKFFGSCLVKSKSQFAVGVFLITTFAMPATACSEKSSKYDQYHIGQNSAVSGMIHTTWFLFMWFPFCSFLNAAKLIPTISHSLILENVS